MEVVAGNKWLRAILCGFVGDSFAFGGNQRRAENAALCGVKPVPFRLRELARRAVGNA